MEINSLTHGDRLQFKRKLQVLTFAHTGRLKEDSCLAKIDLKNQESDRQMQHVWVFHCLILLFCLRLCKRHLAGTIFVNSTIHFGLSLFKMSGSCCIASMTWAFTQLGEVFFSCFLDKHHYHLPRVLERPILQPLDRTNRY